MIKKSDLSKPFECHKCHIIIKAGDGWLLIYTVSCKVCQKTYCQECSKDLNNCINCGEHFIAEIKPYRCKID